MIMYKKLRLLSWFYLFFTSLSFASDKQLADLSENIYWLQLGHYRPALKTNWKSDIDNQDFFVAVNGKYDPSAELKATMAAFDIEVNKQDNTLSCKYPARYLWLREKVANTWPDLNCLEIKKWKETINPAGITLVFPTAFMNSPSSMFGHTLLRIDAKNQTQNQALMAFAVNFAAQPDADDNAAAYAVKGLIGQYPGRFSLMPYYRKVREYNDLESRDIWEYKLNLSAAEVEKILHHLWELQNATFDYYFIDENCSYQLLALLQLAREDLDLTSAFVFQAIPSDTVSVLGDSDLLSEPNYRPAFGTKLYAYSEQMNDVLLAEARSVMSGVALNKTKYTEQEQAAILEMAYEWLNFEFYDQGVSRELIAPRLTDLLIQRSKVKIKSPFLEAKSPSQSPDKGHASSRFSVSYRYDQDYSDRYSLSYRLAYHDLLDASAGFIPAAKISFLDVEVSMDKNNAALLERFYFLDAMSLAPDNRIFDTWSWNLRMGYDRQPDIYKRTSREFIQGGYGKSWGDPNVLHSYLLASTEINIGDITDSGMEIAIGAELGAFWEINSSNKVAIAGNVMHLLNADVSHHGTVDLSWNWALSTNWALRSQVGYHQWITEEKSGKLTIYHYF
jgi:hypothetical protein